MPAARAYFNPENLAERAAAVAAGPLRGLRGSLAGTGCPTISSPQVGVEALAAVLEVPVALGVGSQRSIKIFCWLAYPATPRRAARVEASAGPPGPGLIGAGAIWVFSSAG